MLSEHAFLVKSKDINILSNKFLYYYLKTNENLYKTQQSGNAQPQFYPKNLENNNIILPSLEKQTKIVEYLDKQIEFYQTFFNKIKLFYPNNDDDIEDIDDIEEI